MAFTVHNAMITCGVDDSLLFNGSSAATRIATECFDDDFSSCLDKTMKELDDDLSTYFGLAAVFVIRPIFALLVWTRVLLEVFHVRFKDL